jgi:hypothetical protein
MPSQQPELLIRLRLFRTGVIVALVGVVLTLIR